MADMQKNNQQSQTGNNPMPIPPLPNQSPSTPSAQTSASTASTGSTSSTGAATPPLSKVSQPSSAADLDLSSTYMHSSGELYDLTELDFATGAKEREEAAGSSSTPTDYDSLKRLEFSPTLLQNANVVNADLRGTRVKLTDFQIELIGKDSGMQNLDELIDKRPTLGTYYDTDLKKDMPLENVYHNTVPVEALLLLGSDKLVKDVLNNTYYDDRTLFGSDTQTNKDIHERLEYLSKKVSTVGNVDHDYQDLRQDSVVIAMNVGDTMVSPAKALEGRAMHQDVVGKIRDKSADIDNFKITFQHQAPTPFDRPQDNVPVLEAWSAWDKVREYNSEKYFDTLSGSKQEYEPDQKQQLYVDATHALRFNLPRGEHKDAAGATIANQPAEIFSKKINDLRDAEVVSLYMPGFDGLGAEDFETKLKNDVPYLLVRKDSEHYLVPVEKGSIKEITVSSPAARVIDYSAISDLQERTNAENRDRKLEDDMRDGLVEFEAWLKKEASASFRATVTQII